MLGITALLGAAFSCGQSEVTNEGASAERAPAAERHEHGRAIYNFRCYYCHGYSGDAKTLATTYLTPPPRDFTMLQPGAVSHESMITSVTEGRPGTAMKSFTRMLSAEEIALVVDFVRSEFVDRHLPNTRYHSAENGWPNHERYLVAYPFATGEVALDTPWEQLSPEQRAGKNLFLETCITCHDRARVVDEGKIWDPQALSYPRFDFKPGDSLLPPDAFSGASTYAKHDVPLELSGLTEAQRRGERLFLDNCAFCHAADGTGRNWIGSFLEPHPRDLSSEVEMAGMTRERLRGVIREGLPGTSMPAWRTVLDDREIEDLIAFIDRAFHPLPPEQGGWASDPSS